MRTDLKNRFINAIEQSGYYEPVDFRINEKNNQIQINYQYCDENYYFRFSMPTSKTIREYEEFDSFKKVKVPKKKLVYVFEGTMEPGTFANRESFNVESFEEVIYLFKDWVEFLYKDLISLPISRKLDEQDNKIKEIKTQIDELFTEKGMSANQFMTREEGEVLRAKLDEIEAALKIRIQEDVIDEESKEKESDLLAQDFKKLKNATNTMTKANWLKKFAVTVFTWSTDPYKVKRLSNGVKIIENIGKAVGLNLPQISSMLPLDNEES